MYLRFFLRNNYIVMQIDTYPKTSFGAKFIRTAIIKKVASNLEEYIPVKSSFIEIDSNNLNDVKAVSNIAKYWENEKYASNIDFTVKTLNKKGNDGSTKVFAISTQEKELEKLDDEKILGVAEIEKVTNGLNVRYLQVNPAYIYNSQRIYKYIGSEILNCLKNYYGEPITLNSVRSYAVRRFYENNGFKLVDNETLRYQWLP